MIGYQGFRQKLLSSLFSPKLKIFSDASTASTSKHCCWFSGGSSRPFSCLLSSSNCLASLWQKKISHQLQENNGCGNLQKRFAGRWYEQPTWEMSRHRSRPPTYGIRRHIKLKVVDNSAMGKQAHQTGRVPYCIHVYKRGYRKRHMPGAVLGDKILVAILGEMRRAYVVGAQSTEPHIKHGVPRTDTDNVVLLDKDENPLGTRILVPIPSCLRANRKGNFAKVLAIATKFM